MIGERYFKKMSEEGRFIRIYEKTNTIAFLTFSICNDYLPFRDKGMFQYRPHDPTGSICFIERMAAFKWNKWIRKYIEKAILEKYPQIEQAVWYRPTDGDDRLVIYNIRRYYEAGV